jgi:hypothetical protein
MQIAYKQLSGGSYTVFIDIAAAPSFDSAAQGGSALVDFSPHFTPSSQLEDLASPQSTPSTASFRAPRGNVKGSLDLTFDVPYSSLAAALAAIRTYAALINVQWHLRVVQDTETQYYPNALLTNYQSSVHGTAVLHKMTWITDLVTSTAP